MADVKPAQSMNRESTNLGKNIFMKESIVLFIRVTRFEFKTAKPIPKYC